MKKKKTEGLLWAVVLLIGLPVVAFASGESAPWTRTDTYKVMNFVVLLLVLIYLLRKPVASFFSCRAASIKEELAALEEKKDAAETALADATAKLQSLQMEIDDLMKQYVARGNAEKEKILQETKNTLARMEEQMQHQIDQRVTVAKNEIRTQVAEKALAQAEKIIREQLTPEDQKQLLEKYMKEVAESG